MPDLRETVETDMTDLEITKACAEAMGYLIWEEVPGKSWVMVREGAGFHCYAPLMDDAQAMTLVKRIGIELIPPPGRAKKNWRATAWDGDLEYYAHGLDLNRAICECVAQMQRKRHD